MIQIKSFEELEIPTGLFPSEIAFFLESTISRTVNYLAGLSIEEVNETLAFTRQIMRGMYKAGRDPIMDDILGPAIKKTMSSTDRFSPPKQEKTTNQLMTQFLDKSFFELHQQIMHY